MKTKRGHSYVPRTKHLNKDGSAKFTNRLFLESSPYLLQHAHNPVNWYPWGDEAFDTAKKLNKPVLISIGYSTCHWCHVMEEESFEDIEIATYLNENYIVIKVDREERPDVDNIYMSAIHAMGQNGGWPMNVWLTPERLPYYGGTYFPARDGDRGAGRGFLTLLKILNEAFHNKKDKIHETSTSLAQAVKNNLKPVAGTGIPNKDIMTKVVNYFKNNSDKVDGGIGRRNKFPSSVPSRFLLRSYRKSKDPEVLKIVNLTLTKMSSGGMYDHVAGGFHRYSTDPKWLVPHFEKMLYDNALLIPTYLEAYQVTGNKDFLRVTKELLHYVKKDMTSVDGAYFSATDADSLNHLGHREEGYFFTWTPDELKSLLNDEQYKILTKYYGVTKKGNFEKRNILNTPVSRVKIAKELGISVKKLSQSINESRLILYEARKLRPAPLRDEKIVTAWNGLMISAHAHAGLILNNAEYTSSAIKAAEFIVDNMYKNGRLLRSYKDGIAKNNAYLSDYAFLIAGLLDIFEATGDEKWLRKSIELDIVLEKFFEDKESGGYFMTSRDHEKLLVREKPSYDGAEPAGNSIQALNLLRLGEFTSNGDYKKRAANIFKAFSKKLTLNPQTLTEMLLAVDFYYDNAKEIIIVTPENKLESGNLLRDEFRKSFQPNRIFTIIEQGSKLNKLSELIPLVSNKYSIKGEATAYVCQEGICKLPTRDVLKFSKQINEVD